MISRHCKGCGIEFQVPEPPARGSSREWCTEGCNRRTQRDRRTLELAAVLTAPKAAPAVRISEALKLLGPEITRAEERQRVMLERTRTEPKRARKAPAKRARKGAPRTT